MMNSNLFGSACTWGHGLPCHEQSRTEQDRADVGFEGLSEGDLVTANCLLWIIENIVQARASGLLAGLRTCLVTGVLFWFGSLCPGVLLEG